MSNQKPHISSYEKGMNKDFNVESLPENAYVDALNFRLFTSGDGAVVGGIQNIRGNKLSHRFENNGERVIGSTQLRDALIVFTAISADEPAMGRIYKIQFDFVNDTISVELIYESEELQFTAAAPIEAIAVHETNFIQRVYFSDFVRPTRTMNIADPNLSEIPASSFALFPAPPIKKAKIDYISDVGQLPVGVYNYSYYLVTPGGQKTLLAPVSNQVHIIEDSESEGSTKQYRGSYTTPGEVIYSPKSVTVTVSTSDLEPNQFEKIVFVAIYVGEVGASPQIYEFDEKLIAGNTQEATHSGSESQIIISLADFLSESYPFITNKTFAAKDETLFVANVKTGGFTLTDDEAAGLLTKRYTKDGNTYSDPYVNPFNDESGTVFGAESTGSYDYWLNNYQYMFQPDGTTLGGFAPFLSYTFHLKETRGMDNDTTLTLENSGSNQFYTLDTGYTEVNRSFRNFASPYNRGLRGYKRGETYRFGIVFYDKDTGLASPAYYVGDIKFPELSQPIGTELPGGEKDIINPYTGLPSGATFDHYAVAKAVPENAASQLYTLGLEFSFNFPDSILNRIRGFQIVRVPRTANDRTRLGQGIISKYYNIDVPALVEENGWNETGVDPEHDHWPDRSHTQETFCPMTELPSLFGHLNRYKVHNETEGSVGIFNPGVPGERIDLGFNFLNGDTQLPSAHGFHNGVTASRWIDYQSLFSTPGLVNFFCPEVSYDYGLTGFRRGIDFLKTVGVYGDTKKRAVGGNQLGGSGHTETLGHDFQDEYIVNSSLSGDAKYRPKISDNAPTAGFFKFPGTAAHEDMREFQTKALSTNRLGQLGSQSTNGDISNPTTAAFNLSEAYEAMEGYRILTSVNPFRNESAKSVNGMPILKKCFQSGNPFGYFLKETRLANDGKAAVISLMGDHRDPAEYLGKGLFVGRTSQFDQSNTGLDLTDENTGYAPSYQYSGDTFMVEHIRRVGEQYGGNGADAVFNNYFIACSDPVSITNAAQPNTIKVFQGDTFVCLYEFMKNFWNNYYTDDVDWNGATPDLTSVQAYNGSNSSTFEVVTIPVETVVNIELNAGNTKSAAGTFNGLNYRIQEYPDFKGVGNDTSSGRSKYFHLYDGVFSEETTSKRFFTLPPGQAEAETHFDVRTHYSGTKVLGEDRDSWSDFAIGDYKDLDPQYGPINRLINFKDNLFAFQDNAVGSYLINTRELLSGEQGSALSIGTGAGITDYQYISTEYGCINQFGVTKTDSGVYFIDAKRQKFFSLGQQLIDMSEALGMNDFLRSRLTGNTLLTREQGGDNPLLSKGSHMTYDPMNKEVWLTSLGTASDDFTLCFSEGLKVFSSRYSFLPKIYLQGNKKILSPSPQSEVSLYLHDSGDYGVFYDFNPEESSITIRVNSLAVTNKILRFLEYNSVVKNTSVSPITTEQTVGLTSIQVDNDYQTSGKVALDSRQKRRFRKWRVKLPRDINSQNSLGRFRGTYFDITLFFDNSVNLSIMLERIMSYYDAQIN